MEYFNMSEMTRSATSARLGIDNTPTAAIRANLTALVETVLDPLRRAWGAPIIVTSGYRSTALNKAVGGASASQHVKGEAADIRTVSDAPEDNARLLRLLLRLGLPVDQVISEYPDGKGRPDWIHVSHKRAGGNRGNLLTASRKNGRTVYVSGIRV